MRLSRVTYIGQNALVTTVQLQAYYDGLINVFGMNPIGQPVLRDGANGKVGTALFNDGLVNFGTWGGQFFINILLWRDTIDKRQLETFTKTTFALPSIKSFEDDMGVYAG